MSREPYEVNEDYEHPLDHDVRPTGGGSRGVHGRGPVPSAIHSVARMSHWTGVVKRGPCACPTLIYHIVGDMALGGHGSFPRWRWWTVSAILALAALPMLLKAIEVNGWWWLAGTTALVAAVGITPAKVYEYRIKSHLDRRLRTQYALDRSAIGGGRSRVRGLMDPILVGAHRAIIFNDSPPAYIKRDVHDEIVRSLTPGSFLLILGDSLAGKTRTAFETIRETLPRYHFVAPDRRSAIADAIDVAAYRKRAVLWLDDLERFLGKDEGLCVADVARICDGVIIATLRRAEFHKLMEDMGPKDSSDVRRILDHAQIVSIDRHFSERELDCAEEYRGDPRIDAALDHADEYGIAEYLAAGPELLERWINAASPGVMPRGAALVETATAFRLAGIRPIRIDILNATHWRNLKLRGRNRLRPESQEDAWKWATKTTRGTAALLDVIDDHHVDVFDYIVDHVQRGRPDGVDKRREVLTLLESAAVAITLVSMTLIPPMLQTRPYATEIARQAARMPNFVQGALDVTGERRGILKRANAPRTIAYLSSHILRGPRLTRQIWKDQLNHLLMTTKMQNVDVYILPMEADFHIAMEKGGAAFYEFPECQSVVVPDWPAVALGYTYHQADPAFDEPYMKSIRAAAWDEEKSVQFIEEVLREYHDVD